MLNLLCDVLIVNIRDDTCLKPDQAARHLGIGPEE